MTVSSFAPRSGAVETKTTGLADATLEVECETAQRLGKLRDHARVTGKTGKEFDDRGLDQ